MASVEGDLGRVAGAPLARDVEPSAFARTLIVAGLLIGTIWLIAMSRWILTDSVVPWDSKNQFYAFYRFLASALHDGTSPLWNPYHYGGHPSVADPQSLIFAPLMWLYALFDAAPSLRTFDLLVHAHLLIGGLSVAAIGARARWPVVACVLAAVVFMFGGAAAGRLQHTGIILSYGLFPPALLLLQLALERRSLVIAVTFSLVAAALALNRNQVAMLLCFALAAAAIAEVINAERPLRYLRERFAVLAAMAIIGVALIMAPMLLTIQFAALSNRPEITFDNALLGSLHPAGLAQLVVANIFGSHRTDYWGPNVITEPLVSLTDDSFNYLFVGSVPIILLLWFGIVGGRAFQRGRILFIAMAALALLYAVGRYTPFFGIAFDFVPGVSRFRRPVDASFVFVAALALLCGALLADYIRSRRAAATPHGGHCGGGRRARRRGRRRDVLRPPRPFRRRGRCRAGDRTDRDLRDPDPGPRARRTDAQHRRCCGDRDRGRRAHLVERGVPAQCRAPLRLFGAGAAVRCCRAMRSSSLNAPSRERRRTGERPRVEIVGLGGPWQNAAIVRLDRSGQRLQPAAHRDLRPPGAAGRGQLAGGAARLPGLVRRLRLRACPHARA